MKSKIKSPLVVGYKGEVGSFILNGLLKIMPKALNIWCFDIAESEREKINRIRKADYIFLCVPLWETKQWLIKYKKFLNGKYIVEQCSIKSFLYDSIYDGIKFIHMHLLFRPSATPNKSDRNCIIFEKNTTDSFVKIMEQILNCNIKVKYCTVSEHDRAMAYNQALVHRVLLILDKMCIVGAETFLNIKIKELSDRIRNGNSHLYNIIQRNEYLHEVVKEFKLMIDDDFKIFDVFPTEKIIHKK